MTRTTTVLLDGLHDAENAEAWAEFDRRYRPIVLAFARRLGLPDVDAADAAQETMTRFLEEYRAGRYDRTRGRLRSWLVSLARTRVAQTWRRRATRREVQPATAVGELEDTARLTVIWDEEQRQHVLREAMRRLRETTRLGERTMQAFELLVVGQAPVESVARQLGMSAQDVYLAKSRVARKLREIIASLEAAYGE